MLGSISGKAIVYNRVFFSGWDKSDSLQILNNVVGFIQKDPGSGCERPVMIPSTWVLIKNPALLEVLNGFQLLPLYL